MAVPQSRSSIASSCLLLWLVASLLVVVRGDPVLDCDHETKVGDVEVTTVSYSASGCTFQGGLFFTTTSQIDEVKGLHLRLRSCTLQGTLTIKNAKLRDSVLLFEDVVIVGGLIVSQLSLAGERSSWTITGASSVGYMWMDRSVVEGSATIYFVNTTWTAPMSLFAYNDGSPAVGPRANSGYTVRDNLAVIVTGTRMDSVAFAIAGSSSPGGFYIGLSGAFSNATISIVDCAFAGGMSLSHTTHRGIPSTEFNHSEVLIRNCTTPDLYVLGTPHVLVRMIRQYAATAEYIGCSWPNPDHPFRYGMPSHTLEDEGDSRVVTVLPEEVLLISRVEDGTAASCHFTELGVNPSSNPSRVALTDVLAAGGMLICGVELVDITVLRVTGTLAIVNTTVTNRIEVSNSKGLAGFLVQNVSAGSVSIGGSLPQGASFVLQNSRISGAVQFVLFTATNASITIADASCGLVWFGRSAFHSASIRIRDTNLTRPGSVFYWNDDVAEVSESINSNNKLRATGAALSMTTTRLTNTIVCISGVTAPSATLFMGYRSHLSNTTINVADSSFANILTDIMASWNAPKTEATEMTNGTRVRMRNCSVSSTLVIQGTDATLELVGQFAVTASLSGCRWPDGRMFRYEMQPGGGYFPLIPLNAAVAAATFTGLQATNSSLPCQLSITDCVSNDGFLVSSSVLDSFAATNTVGGLQFVDVVVINGVSSSRGANTTFSARRTTCASLVITGGVFSQGAFVVLEDVHVRDAIQLMNVAVNDGARIHFNQLTAGSIWIARCTFDSASIQLGDVNLSRPASIMVWNDNQAEVTYANNPSRTRYSDAAFTITATAMYDTTLCMTRMSMGSGGSLLMGFHSSLSNVTMTVVDSAFDGGFQNTLSPWWNGIITDATDMTNGTRIGFRNCTIVGSVVLKASNATVQPIRQFASVVELVGCGWDGAFRYGEQFVPSVELRPGAAVSITGLQANNASVGCQLSVTDSYASDGFVISASTLDSVTMTRTTGSLRISDSVI